MKTLFYINLIIIFTISILGPYHAFINFEPAKDEYIVVKQGESMTRTLDNLVKSNIVDTIFFKVFLAIENIDSFQAGKYKVEEKSLKEMEQQANIFLTQISKNRFYFLDNMI